MLLTGRSTADLGRSTADLGRSTADEEMIKNTSNIEKCQPVSLYHDQFALYHLSATHTFCN